MSRPTEPMAFINYYRCTCGHDWADIWSCKCDDRCPECNTSISPYKSEDIDDDD